MKNKRKNIQDNQSEICSIKGHIAILVRHRARARPIKCRNVADNTAVLFGHALHFPVIPLSESSFGCRHALRRLSTRCAQINHAEVVNGSSRVSVLQM